MRIIAAIDIIEGKCIRLHQGDYNQKTVYNENPLEVAKHFEDAGLKYLHLVDLDGAKAGKIIHYNILEKIVSRTKLQVDFSGGITNDEMIKIPFECGAAQVTIGTVAVKDPETTVRWLNKYGADKIIVAADVKNEKIYIHGWQEESKLYVYDFIENYAVKGIKYLMCTDISKDGTMQGASVALYKKIRQSFEDIRLIASGGIGSMKDVEACFNAGCEGAIIGKAIYENKIKISDLVKFTS
jgi:phosphoribosylformimino-5-aminoimidazole carboxamide ribotide isomerase